MNTATPPDKSRLRLLLVMEQCNPEWSSVPRVAFHLFDHLRRIADVTLVTHERNRDALTRRTPEAKMVFIAESAFVRDYYSVVAKLTSRGNVNWPLQHALGYPVYAEFDRKVKEKFADTVRAGVYDAVLGMTPVLPRYPYSFAGFSEETPFILGPVNGGLPFPDAFSDVAAKESAKFNFLRRFCSLIPGYNRTYREADAIIAGSTFTRDWIENSLGIAAEKLHLVAENGITPDYFSQPIRPTDPDAPLRLLFAGRLVPYKGGDMLLDALALASPQMTKPPLLQFVGDGPEKESLAKQSHALGLTGQVEFTGLIPPEEMPARFFAADLFCFPSIREFGGAVVLEAMAAGVPCIVADHGGIGEYVREGAGIRIAPQSRADLVTGMADALVHYDRNRDALRDAAVAARECAKPYLWENKAKTILDIVDAAVGSKVEGGDLTLAS